MMLYSLSRREYLAWMMKSGALLGLSSVTGLLGGCGGGQIGEFNNVLGTASIPNPENFDLEAKEFSLLYDKPFFIADSFFGEGLFLPDGTKISNKDHIRYILQATTDVEIDFALGLIPPFEQSQADFTNIINKEDVYYINDWAMKCHVGLCAGVNFIDQPNIFSALYGRTKFTKQQLLNEGVSLADINALATDKILDGQSLTTDEKNMINEVKQRIVNQVMNGSETNHFAMNLRVVRSNAEIFGDGPSKGAENRPESIAFFNALIAGDNKFSVSLPTRLPSMVTAHEVNHSSVLDNPNGRFHPNEGKLVYGERLSEHGALVSKSGMRSLYEMAPTTKTSQYLEELIEAQLAKRLAPGANLPGEGYVKKNQFTKTAKVKTLAKKEGTPLYRVYDPHIGGYLEESAIYESDIRAAQELEA